MNQPFDDPPQRAWLEVDLDALTRNAERIAAHVAPARLIPMIKADGYGTGATEAARALDGLDPYAYGVATPEEGIALRRDGIQRRIIVFAPEAELDADRLIENRLETSVLSLASLERFAADGRSVAADATGGEACLRLHLEIDTGMGRAGLPHERCGDWAPRVAAVFGGGRVALESAYTHFHSAGSDGASTEQQLSRLKVAVQALESVGLRVPLIHAANSDAVIRDAQYHLDLVRPGIYLYGGRRGASVDGPLGDPESVVRVRARVLEVRDLAPGSTVSYGANYVTSESERLATLGIGYADGVLWQLSNRGAAIIAGARVPIRGNICMDVTVVDVSAVSGVEPTTVATLLGRDGQEEITLGQLAEMAQTIEYEVLTSIGPRLPRQYVSRSDGADERNG